MTILSCFQSSLQFDLIYVNKVTLNLYLNSDTKAKESELTLKHCLAGMMIYSRTNCLPERSFNVKVLYLISAVALNPLILKEKSTEQVRQATSTPPRDTLTEAFREAVKLQHQARDANVLTRDRIELFFI